MAATQIVFTSFLTRCNEMRNPQGNATIVGDLPRGTPTIVESGVRHQEVEIDTFTCGHCNAVKHVPVRANAADIGGLCKQCLQLICSKCVDKGICTPFEKKLQEMEERNDWRRTIGEF